MEAGTGPPVKKVGDGDGAPRRGPRALVPVVHAEEAPGDDVRGRHGRHAAVGPPPPRPRVARPLRGRPRACGRTTRPRCASGDWYEFRDPGQMWERPYYQAGTVLRAADRGRRAHRPARARLRRLHARVGRVPAQAPPGAGVHRARHLARARERRARHAVRHGHALRRARGGDEAAPGTGVPAVRDGPRGAVRGLPGRAGQARASCTTTSGSRRAATSSGCARRRTGASA